MDEVDRYVRSRTGYRQAVLMPVEDLFSISAGGGGNGSGDRGVVKVGDGWRLGDPAQFKTVCTGWKMFGRSWIRGRRGIILGVLLRGTKRGMRWSGGKVVRSLGVYAAHEV